MNLEQSSSIVSISIAVMSRSSEPSLDTFSSKPCLKPEINWKFLSQIWSQYDQSKTKKNKLKLCILPDGHLLHVTLPKELPLPLLLVTRRPVICQGGVKSTSPATIRHIDIRAYLYVDIVISPSCTNLTCSLFKTILYHI